jgi:hypothetical protein
MIQAQVVQTQRITWFDDTQTSSSAQDQPTYVSDAERKVWLRFNLRISVRRRRTLQHGPRISTPPIRLRFVPLQGLLGHTSR